MSLLVFAALFLPVIISGLSIFLFKLSARNLKLITTFSGAFLLGICFLEIIPEIFSEGPGLTTGIFILIGFFVQLVLEFVTRGVEHGHDMPDADRHDHSHKHSFLVLPIIIGLCIHSFLEAMPLAENYPDPAIRNTLLTGIVIHNIPISVVLMGLLCRNCKKGKAMPVALLTLFALAGPAGVLFSNFLGTELAGTFQNFYNYMLAIVVGIFLHISTTILFETEENHRINFLKFTVVILGFALTILLTILE